MSQLIECPYCESKEGYYLKTRIVGSTEERYRFDGSYHDDDNPDVHDSLSYKQGKYAYCRNCHKKLFDSKS